MSKSFRGKNSKDTETLSETLIHFEPVVNQVKNHKKSGMGLGVTQQLADQDNFDSFLEKRIY